jgi:hypothetical protein
VLGSEKHIGVLEAQWGGVYMLISEELPWQLSRGLLITRAHVYCGVAMRSIWTKDKTCLVPLAEMPLPLLKKARKERAYHE